MQQNRRPEPLRPPCRRCGYRQRSRQARQGKAQRLCQTRTDKAVRRASIQQDGNPSQALGRRDVSGQPRLERRVTPYPRPVLCSASQCRQMCLKGRRQGVDGSIDPFGLKCRHEIIKRCLCIPRPGGKATSRVSWSVRGPLCRFPMRPAGSRRLRQRSTAWEVGDWRQPLRRRVPDGRRGAD